MTSVIGCWGGGGGSRYVQVTGSDSGRNVLGGSTSVEARVRADLSTQFPPRQLRSQRAQGMDKLPVSAPRGTEH